MPSDLSWTATRRKVPAGAHCDFYLGWRPDAFGKPQVLRCPEVASLVLRSSSTWPAYACRDCAQKLLGKAAKQA